MTQERKAQEYVAEFWVEIVSRSVKWKEGIKYLVPPPINRYDKRPMTGEAISAGKDTIKAGYTWSTNTKNHIGISLALITEKNINKKTI